MTYKIIPLPKNSTNYTGKICSRAIVIAPVVEIAPAPGIRGVKWLCVCHCGRTFIRRAETLKRLPHILSCGCLAYPTLHGGKRSTEYRIWAEMIQRCTNPNHSRYQDYGGRGIYVCETWRQSFSAFYTDMKARPTGTSLDRIDNDGPYGPTNCRWATQKEQARNRRYIQKSSRLITYGAHTRTLSDWARHIGIKTVTLHARLRKGWSMEQALQPKKIPK